MIFGGGGRAFNFPVKFRGEGRFHHEPKSTVTELDFNPKPYTLQ